MNPQISSCRQKYVWGRCFLVVLYSTERSRSRGQVEVFLEAWLLQYDKEAPLSSAQGSWQHEDPSLRN